MLSLLSFIPFVSLVLATPIHPRSSTFTLKHALSAPPPNWIKLPTTIPTSHLLKLKIGLKQSNIGSLLEHLEKSSDPSHELYGTHLSVEEVNEHIRPDDSVLERVQEWFADHGIEKASCHFSPAKDWVSVTVPVSVAESMLNTKYNIYAHSSSPSTTIVRTEQYSLPEFIHADVDTIAPTTWFSRMHAEKKESRFGLMKGSALKSGKVAAGGVPDICDTDSVTNECLRVFYGSLDYVPQAINKNAVGVTGYLGEAASFNDLHAFLAQERPDAVNATFDVVLINGGENPQVLNQTQIADGVGLEANLDVETVVGVTFPTPVTFYSTGGSPPFIPDTATPTDSNEPYLEWLTFVLAQHKLPGVVSTSYDDDEQTVPKDLAIRVCNEFANLGARGVSVLFASGDSGVGDDGTCIANDGSGKETFLPNFPSSCPFVTSVGGTMNFAPEIAIDFPDFDFFSGGGFSNYFARPAYQNAVVAPYVASLGTANAGLFNPAGRGYPDVSAQSVNFLINWQQQFGVISGTSASTPLFSGLIGLVNDARIAKGLPTLGFLNPFLYTVGVAGLNDVTIGSSAGCGTNGFPAQVGWDAVTGLGTPNFTQLVEIATASPSRHH